MRAARVRLRRPVRRAGILLALLGLVQATACGKKGDPAPPLPQGPRAISDLAIEVEDVRAALSDLVKDQDLSRYVL